MYNNISMAKCFQPTMYVFIAPPPYTYVLLKYILCLIDYSLELIKTTRKLNDSSGWLNILYIRKVSYICTGCYCRTIANKIFLAITHQPVTSL